MANADNACQARAAAAGLSGTYLALMYETVLSELNNCNKITVLRYPTDYLARRGVMERTKNRRDQLRMASDCDQRQRHVLG